MGQPAAPWQGVHHAEAVHWQMPWHNPQSLCQVPVKRQRLCISIRYIDSISRAHNEWAPCWVLTC